MPIPGTIASRIREVRGDQTQKEFAERLGMSQQYISALESDKETPNYSFLSSLTKRYKISIDWLMGNSENKEMIDITEVRSKKRNIEVKNEKLIEFCQIFAFAEIKSDIYPELAFILKIPDDTIRFIKARGQSNKELKKDLVEHFI